MIEVELRAFIDSTTYNRLLGAFGFAKEHMRQVTYYLDTNVDTRIQVSTQGGRLWQKLGKMHADAREEYELVLTQAEARTMRALFANLGFGVKVAWFRERSLFQLDDIVWTVDDTIGYGKIVEAELLVDESEVEEARARLKDAFAKLGIAIPEKVVFDEAYKQYLLTWETLTQGLDETWVETLGV